LIYLHPSSFATKPTQILQAPKQPCEQLQPRIKNPLDTRNNSIQAYEILNNILLLTGRELLFAWLRTRAWEQVRPQATSCGLFVCLHRSVERRVGRIGERRWVCKNVPSLRGASIQNHWPSV